jgi:RNA-binding protein
VQPTLTNPQIRKLKALAQRMEPTAKVGKAGISEAFVKSIDQLLDLHELIKVRFDEFKEEKKALGAQLAESTNSTVVMQVGHVIVLYREQQDPARRKVRFD